MAFRSLVRHRRRRRAATLPSIYVDYGGGGGTTSASARGYVVFSTSATGSSSSLVTQTPGTAGGTGQTVPGVVGSAALPFRGTLHVTVPRSGGLRVTADGRPAVRLRPGRYTAVVADDSPRRGLAVRTSKGHETAITSLAFTGRKTVTVSLAAGASFAATRREDDGAAVPQVATTAGSRTVGQRW